MFYIYNLRLRKHLAIKKAKQLGSIKSLAHAAAPPPPTTSQATAIILEEFGKNITEGSTGVIIPAQSGYRLPALTAKEDALLATALH